MHEQKRGNTVILFGAGAVIPWGGPPTPELTKILINCGFKTKHGDEYITRFIYNELLQSGFTEGQVNFETVINVIEELIVYNAHFDWQKKTPGMLKVFLEAKHTDSIYNYSYNESRRGHGYALDIPEGQEYEFAKRSYQDEDPNQFFLQHIIAGLLSRISERVGEYAWHTDGHSKINFDSAHSKQFVKWIKSIAINRVPRLYTLNYDRLFKVLLERAGIKVFEGFDCGETIPFEPYRHRANVKRILTDFENPVHYNLHGSVYWMAEALDNHQLPNPELFLKGIPDYPMNHDFPLAQVEKGKTIMVSNIVAGYQKGQRSLITPLKQMQAAFDRDCCFADEIIVVGYSLGDEHINESIKTAMRHNHALKITFINPSFKRDQIDLVFAQKISPYRDSGNWQPYTIHNGISDTFYNGMVMVYTISFEQYLAWHADPMKKYLLKRPDNAG